MTNDFDAADAGAVVGERALNANAVGHPADGEGFADPAALNLDDYAFKILKPLARTLDNLNVYADGITNFQLRKIGAQLFFFKFPDDVSHF